MGVGLLWLVGGYLCWMGLVYVTQRSMLFPGTGRSDGGRGGAAFGYEVLDLGGVPPGNAWLLPAADPGPAGAPLVIHAHGNGELIDDWFGPLTTYRAMGVAVLLVEYPGYGGTPGAPSEKSIRAAVTAAYDAVVKRPDIDASKVIVHGRSLGGGAAGLLMRDRPVVAAVLESTFTSIAAMSARFLVPTALIRDPFDTIGAVAAFGGPILVLHGNRDRLIPFAHGKKLAAAARNGRFVERDCGHSDCPLDEGFWTPIRELVQGV